MDESFLTRFEKVQRTGDGRYKACCPAHDDSDPSLTILFPGDGRILIHCFAGCDSLSVVQALGLSMKDLFPDGSLHDRLMGGRDHIKRAKVSESLNHERLVLDMTAGDRDAGRKLSPADLKREREAYRKVQAH